MIQKLKRSKRKAGKTRRVRERKREDSFKKCSRKKQDALGCKIVSGERSQVDSSSARGPKPLSAIQEPARSGSNYVPPPHPGAKK